MCRLRKKIMKFHQYKTFKQCIAKIEVSPHCRRPHFAIRWTEKGHSVPKLVPVNGCLVNRSKLLPVPTGYLGPAG